MKLCPCESSWSDSKPFGADGPAFGRAHMVFERPYSCFRPFWLILDWRAPQVGNESPGVVTIKDCVNDRGLLVSREIARREN